MSANVRGDASVSVPGGERTRSTIKRVDKASAKSKASLQKLKLLYLMHLFESETDKHKGLGISDLIEELAARGITAERKALYRDIDTLRAFGMDIRSVKHLRTEYYLHSRTFSATDLKLMIDAVRSARLLTSYQSDNLVRKIRALAPVHQQANLMRPMDLVTCKNMENALVIQNLENIQAALAQKKRIQFRYGTYNTKGEIEYRHGGKVYEETPVRLVYAESFYYLVAFNAEENDFKHYRVDRIYDLLISDVKALRHERIAAYESNAMSGVIFGMFGHEETAKNVTLLVHESAVNSVLDRFGVDVNMLPGDGDDNCARITVSVVESPPFYGWLAQFGSLVKIESPSSVREGYLEHLRATIDAY